MSFYGNRGGHAPVRTATQLSEVLRGPLYLVLTGTVDVIFPQTGRAAPSAKVGFRAVRPMGSDAELLASGTWINWKQWNEVVVPLFEDQRVTAWFGTLGGDTGDDVVLPRDIYVPGGSGEIATTSGGTVLSEGTVVGTKTPTQRQVASMFLSSDEYITALGGLILLYAQAAGYE